MRSRILFHILLAFSRIHAANLKHLCYSYIRPHSWIRLVSHFYSVRKVSRKYTAWPNFACAVVCNWYGPGQICFYIMYMLYDCRWPPFTSQNCARRIQILWPKTLINVDECRRMWSHSQVWPGSVQTPSSSVTYRPSLGIILRYCHLLWNTRLGIGHLFIQRQWRILCQHYITSLPAIPSCYDTTLLNRTNNIRLYVLVPVGYCFLSSRPKCVWM